MKKLWQKKNENLDPLIERFETKDDLLMDQKLLKFDVIGSLAHAKMLRKIGILSDKELTQLTKGLMEILNLGLNGKFILQQREEDIHTKIENYLTDKFGTVGKKIHTGRSRNDQVLTALRLFTKEKLLLIWQDLLTLIASFQAYSKKYEFVPMPGFTHMQKAMPSSVGMWSGSFTESFLDDLILIKACYSLINKSPLGSAAGYGVPLKLDRQYTAELLGFDGVQINSLYTQNSRGKIEASVVAALNSVMVGINKFSSDVLFFTSSELRYFEVADQLSSGSSIMPQKKNVDIAELLRSKVHLTLGYYTQLLGLYSNLISGYNRDLQDSKKPFIEALDVVQDSIKVTNILINNLLPRKEKLEEALSDEIFAAHKALELVSQGMPFRQAYKKVGANLSALTIKDKSKFLTLSTHIGGTANLQLNQYQSKLKQEKSVFQKEYQNFQNTIIKLIGKQDYNRN